MKSLFRLFTESRGLCAVMLCTVLLFGTMSTAGCSGASVAQDIVNWTPALDSAASTIATVDPVLLPEATAFIALSQVVDGQAQAYLANPSATALGALQAAVVKAQQQANASLLSAVRITDAATQKHVLAAIQTYSTIINAVLGLVQSVSSKTAVARMAAVSTVKLAQVEPYLDRERSAQMIAAHYAEPVGLARMQVVQARDNLAASGF